MFIKPISFLLIGLSLIGASSCKSTRVSPDLSLSPLLANDATLILKGCGSQSTVGYLYCRKTEGVTASDSVSLFVPDAKCDQVSCVNYKIFGPNGDLMAGGSVLKGMTEVRLKWSDLLKDTEFRKAYRGFWIILLEVDFIDKDGFKRKSFTEGEIRLRVLSKDYTPLNEVKDSNLFIWQFTQDNKIYKYTTSLRAFAGDIE